MRDNCNYHTSRIAPFFHLYKICLFKVIRCFDKSDLLHIKYFNNINIKEICINSYKKPRAAKFARTQARTHTLSYRYMKSLLQYVCDWYNVCATVVAFFCLVPCSIIANDNFTLLLRVSFSVLCSQAWCYLPHRDSKTTRDCTLYNQYANFCTMSSTKSQTASEGHSLLGHRHFLLLRLAWSGKPGWTDQYLAQLLKQSHLTNIICGAYITLPRRQLYLSLLQKDCWWFRDQARTLLIEHLVFYTRGFWTNVSGSVRERAHENVIRFST